MGGTLRRVTPEMTFSGGSDLPEADSTQLSTARCAPACAVGQQRVQGHRILHADTRQRHILPAIPYPTSCASRPRQAMQACRLKQSRVQCNAGTQAGG